MQVLHHNGRSVFIDTANWVTSGNIILQAHDVTRIIIITITIIIIIIMWLNGRAFARDHGGRGFESQPVHFQVTALGKLLTRMCLCHQAV